MKRNSNNYLTDILIAIIDMDEFTVGLSFEDFSKDKKTIAAVIRNLEIIGEAAKNVPSFIRHEYPSIPWKQMAGIRDKIIHQYWSVDQVIVWETLKVNIPSLKEEIEKLIKQSRNQ